MDKTFLCIIWNYKSSILYFGKLFLSRLLFIVGWRAMKKFHTKSYFLAMLLYSYNVHCWMEGRGNVSHKELPSTIADIRLKDDSSVKGSYLVAQTNCLRSYKLNYWLELKAL